VRVAPDRLLVAAEAGAVVVAGVSLAAAGHWIIVPLLSHLPAAASFIALAATLGLLVRLALDLPNAIRLFHAWHIRTCAELLHRATRRRWATTTDLTPTGNGHDLTL
jgi:hypothetical protein